jgi:hypothetical protein
MLLGLPGKTAIAFIQNSFYPSTVANSLFKDSASVG